MKCTIVFAMIIVAVYGRIVFGEESNALREKAKSLIAQERRELS